MTDFLPLVSGYTVTFASPWAAENASTFILSRYIQNTVSINIEGYFDLRNAAW